MLSKHEVLSALDAFKADFQSAQTQPEFESLTKALMKKLTLLVLVDNEMELKPKALKLSHETAELSAPLSAERQNMQHNFCLD